MYLALRAAPGRVSSRAASASASTARRDFSSSSSSSSSSLSSPCRLAAAPIGSFFAAAPLRATGGAPPCRAALATTSVAPSALPLHRLRRVPDARVGLGMRAFSSPAAADHDDAAAAAPARGAATDDQDDRDLDLSRAIRTTEEELDALLGFGSDDSPSRHHPAGAADHAADDSEASLAREESEHEQLLSNVIVHRSDDAENEHEHEHEHEYKLEHESKGAGVDADALFDKVLAGIPALSSAAPARKHQPAAHMPRFERAAADEQHKRHAASGEHGQSAAPGEHGQSAAPGEHEHQPLAESAAAPGEHEHQPLAESAAAPAEHAPAKAAESNEHAERKRNVYPSAEPRDAEPGAVTGHSQRRVVPPSGPRPPRPMTPELERWVRLREWFPYTDTLVFYRLSDLPPKIRRADIAHVFRLAGFRDLIVDFFFVHDRVTREWRKEVIFASRQPLPHTRATVADRVVEIIEVEALYFLASLDKEVRELGGATLLFTNITDYCLPDEGVGNFLSSKVLYGYHYSRISCLNPKLVVVSFPTPLEAQRVLLELSITQPHLTVEVMN